MAPLPDAVDGSAITAVTMGAGSTVVIGTAGGGVEVRPDGASTPSASASRQLFTEPVLAVAVSGDGTTFAAASSSRVYVGPIADPGGGHGFDLVSADPTLLVSDAALALDESGDTVAVSTDSDLGVATYDAASGTQTADYPQPHHDDERYSYHTLAFSQDGTELYATDNFAAEAWNTRSGNLSWSVRGSFQQWSPDARSIIETGLDGHAVTHDSKTGSATRDFTAVTGAGNYIMGSAVTDAKRVYIFANTGDLSVWGPSGTKPLAHIEIERARSDHGGSVVQSLTSDYLVVGVATDDQFIEQAHRPFSHYYIVHVTG